MAALWVPQWKNNKCVLTYFIEIERKIAGHRTVEARFQIRCPAIAEPMRTAFVPFADACDTRKHRLISVEEKKENTHTNIWLRIHSYYKWVHIKDFQSDTCIHTPSNTCYSTHCRNIFALLVCANFVRRLACYSPILLPGLPPNYLATRHR